MRSGPLISIIASLAIGGVSCRRDTQTPPIGRAPESMNSEASTPATASAPPAAFASPSAVASTTACPNDVAKDACQFLARIDPSAAKPFAALRCKSRLLRLRPFLDSGQCTGDDDGFQCTTEEMQPKASHAVLHRWLVGMSACGSTWIGSEAVDEIDRGRLTATLSGDAGGSVQCTLKEEASADGSKALFSVMLWCHLP